MHENSSHLKLFDLKKNWASLSHEFLLKKRCKWTACWLTLRLFHLVEETILQNAGMKECSTVIISSHWCFLSALVTSKTQLNWEHELLVSHLPDWRIWHQSLFVMVDWRKMNFLLNFSVWVFNLCECKNKLTDQFTPFGLVCACHTPVCPMFMPLAPMSKMPLCCSAPCGSLQVKNKSSVSFCWAQERWADIIAISLLASHTFHLQKCKHLKRKEIDPSIVNLNTAQFSSNFSQDQKILSLHIVDSARSGGCLLTWKAKAQGLFLKPCHWPTFELWWNLVGLLFSQVNEQKMVRHVWTC